MKIAPYIIGRFVVGRTVAGDRTYDVNYEPHLEAETAFPGYFVKSTAPYNTDNLSDQDRQALSAYAKPEDAKAWIESIAQDLHRIHCDPSIRYAPELVIAVHGYNMLETTVLDWYNNLYRYIANDDPVIRQRRNIVFVGYRWSSERMSLSAISFWKNVIALPDIPRWILILSMALVLRFVAWPIVTGPWGKALATVAAIKPVKDLMASSWIQPVINWAANTAIHPLFIMIDRVALSLIFLLAFSMMTLLLLRMFVYFRDVYRAMNFAVPDLTELIRQIDYALANLQGSALTDSPPHSLADSSIEIKESATPSSASPQKIKLNFLGHSMGSLVITNTVRVLSDVFDQRSIAQQPVPDIGSTLSLSRLVLASPDIPVLSIVSSRANGLASSLRRFDEAYLFSNEGDLALRLASMTANYIFFPSAHDHHGHRLGSIALVNGVQSSDPLVSPRALPQVSKRTGVINLGTLRQYYPKEMALGKAISQDKLDILQCLFITRSVPRVQEWLRGIFFQKKSKKKDYVSLKSLFDRSKDEVATIADFFTFFDCTDYKDTRLKIEPCGQYLRSKKQSGVLTLAKRKENLLFFDYLLLMIAWMRGKCDVHGGYFQGEYSRELIYRIAFLGFDGTLKAIATETDHASPKSFSPSCSLNPEDALTALSNRCLAKGIQVYLSPLRYRVDVQGDNLAKAKQEMLETVKSDPLSVDA